MAGRVAKSNGGERPPTQRVVIERARVIVLPPGTEELDDGLIHRAIEAGGVQDAWVERGVFAGDRMDQAIEAYSGKPGTPDAKVGEWKAIPVTNWKGGVRHVAPPLPLVVRERIG